MESSSRILQHENAKKLIFFSKSSKLNSDLCRIAEILTEITEGPHLVTPYFHIYNTSCTVVIGTSMERFSRELQH